MSFQSREAAQSLYAYSWNFLHAQVKMTNERTVVQMLILKSGVSTDSAFLHFVATVSLIRLNAATMLLWSAIDAYQIKSTLHLG